MIKKAVVLVSGGLDSATMLAIAKSEGYHCYALSIDYHQRHKSELNAAKAICESVGVCEHRLIQLDLSLFGGSALTDLSLALPVTASKKTDNTSIIPITYVPARNTIFLSLALTWAEVISAFDIFIGVNAVDYSGYPDCRPDFIHSFEQLANLATKVGVEGRGRFKIHTPLIFLSKAEIIKKGLELGLGYELTVSCYQANELGEACGVCESCRIRAEGFQQAAVKDVTRYESLT